MLFKNLSREVLDCNICFHLNIPLSKSMHALEIVFLIIGQSNQIWIGITLFRLIWHQTKFYNENWKNGERLYEHLQFYDFLRNGKCQKNTLKNLMMRYIFENRQYCNLTSLDEKHRNYKNITGWNSKFWIEKFQTIAFEICINLSHILLISNDNWRRK